MCTVTYVPKADGFILTSNRDERLTRDRAIPPQKYDLNSLDIFCPKDPLSGGTWLLTSENNYTLCLLNGALKPHEKQASYRHSRGQILLDFFSYDNEAAFFKGYNVTDIEPFSLLVIHATTGGIVFNVFRWDGEQRYVELMDPNRAQIFSSSTLYSDDTKVLRRQWLETHLQNNIEVTIANMVDFHANTQPQDIHNGLRILRGKDLMTVSICSIDYNPDRTKILYWDLIRDRRYSYRVLHLKAHKSCIGK